MKTRLRSVASILVLAAACLPAVAADRRPGYVGVEQRLSPEQLREIGLTAAQIKLLDRYLRESEAAGPASTARSDEAQDGPRDFRGLPEPGEGPIRSRLQGSVAGWEPGTVFALENGQRWQVLKGRMRLRKPYRAPDIVIVPGIAGRWFLQVDEDLPKARVRRID